MVLAGVSLGASFLPIHHWALPVALVIASLKATLVGAAFMHLTEASFPVYAAIGFALGLTLLLVGFVLADVYATA